MLDEISNALDEAERLACAGACEDEEWPGRCLDGVALGTRGLERGSRGGERGAGNLGHSHAPNLVRRHRQEEATFRPRCGWQDRIDRITANSAKK